MATYYVRTDGSDTNAGTGPATNRAWQTITKAIGATGIAPGDTLYIAPGIYRGLFTAAFTNPANEGQRVTIAGNPTASQFSGINAGPVVITNFLTNTTTSAGNVFVIDKDYVTVQDICFTGNNAGGAPYYNIWASTAVSLIMTRCLMYQPTASTENYFAYFAVKAGGVGANISRCVFLGGGITLQGLTHSGTWNSQTTVTDSIFINQNTYFQTNNAVRLQSQTSGQHGGVKIINCYLSAGAAVVGQSQMSTTHPSLVQNCLIEAPVGISALTNNGQITQSYNVIQSSTPLTNVASSGTTITNGFATINASISKIQGWADYPFISALTSAQAGINGGINTNSLAADIYGTSWLTPTTPTIGASEFASYTPSSQYLPTERNASTITIAPGSTSQSIELYLGATGLAFNTSGLSAYYIRNRSAPVAITLVTQTATGAWTSGGFAQISSSLTPGVYRLDLPDAALAAGADDVTVVVRGASGTNGAVMTVKLSSGGLTSAQTASAVLDAVGSSYVTAGSIGYAIQNSNVASISGSTAAADELEGALLHNGTDYISAELLTPVTSAALVRMGPYEVKADGLGASDPLDIQKGAQHGVDIQCVDGNGNGIDITSATVTAKVYNSGGSLVDTYSCTATYAADGRATFTIDTTVTNSPGTYTATITRTTGASDTQVFGPLRIYVRDI